MKKITKWTALLFTVFWLLFVMADYWQKHPVYYYAIEHFSFYGLFMFLLLLGSGVGWLILKKGKKGKMPYLFNGLMVFALFLLICLVSVGMAYGQFFPTKDFNGQYGFQALMLFVGTALAIYFIIGICYLLGQLFHRFIGLALKKEGDEFVVSLANGIMVLVMAMFLLGVFSLVRAVVLFPLFAALIFFERKNAYAFLKRTSIEPIKLPKKLNVLGVASFIILLAFTSFNFVSANVPLPTGYDSLTFYANLSSLIAQNDGLVAGYQPYNWSLFMSLGYVLFASPEVTLALSMIAGVLSLWAMYQIGRNCFGMDVNYSLMALMLFYITQAVVVQSSGEFKIDLGLLFIYLCIVILMFSYFRQVFRKQKEGQTDQKERLFQPTLLCIGLLSGFALGVKLTTLFFVMALVCSFWYAHAKSKGFIGAFLFCMFIVLLLGIDGQSGLRVYHINVGYLQIGCLLASLLLLGGVFWENKQNMFRALRTTIVFSAFFLLPMIPWLTKNAMEVGSLSPQKLLSGKTAAPEINFRLLEKNLQNPNE